MIADPVHPASRGDLVAPRATLGCIQLPTDLTLDEEGPALVARVPGVRLRLQKLELDGEALGGAMYASARGRIERAARTLRPADSLDAVGLACTSLAFTLGPDEVQAELRAPHPHAEATDMASALLAALRAVGARRVALLTPYDEALHGRCVELLERAGHEVLAERALGLSTDEEITAVTPATIAELCVEVDDPRADVVAICCSAFRACGPGFIDELERTLAKTVVTSQQAFLWDLLRRARVDDAVGGYGRLLRMGRVARPVVRPMGPGVAPDAEPDLYPSRVAAPGVVERVDPVVCEANRGRGPLSEGLVDRFEQRGAVVLPGVFGADEVDHLRAEVGALRRHYEAMDRGALDRATDMRVITERGGGLAGAEVAASVLKSVWQLHLPPDHAPHLMDAAGLLRRTLCDARLVDVARQLLGEEVYVHQSRINFQRGLGEGGTWGSGFLWHQDFEQWHAEDGMPRMRALSMAVLLEPAVPANGALMVMPGSHRRLVQAFAPDRGGDHTDGSLSRGPRLPVEHVRQLADRHGIEHCVGEPGDVVLLDCNVVHGSHTNISPWGRCMVFAVYNAVSNTPAPRPYGAPRRRPEHLGSHDPRFCGVPLPSLVQSLVGRSAGAAAKDARR